MALKIQLVICVHAMRKLKVTNTFSCAVNSSFFKLSAKDQVNIFYMIIHQTTNFLSHDIIKLVINFLINSCFFDRPLIRFNQRVLYIFFHLFILSNSVKFNLCKFSVAYIASCKSTIYYSFKLFFLFKQKSCFFILLFAANYKVNKYYMSVTPSIESVYLNWMISILLYVFPLALYWWFMSGKINIIEKKLFLLSLVSSALLEPITCDLSLLTIL